MPKAIVAIVAHDAMTQPVINPINKLQIQNLQFQRFFSKSHIDTQVQIIHYDQKTAKEYESRCEKGDIEGVRTYGPDLLYGLKGLKSNLNKAMQYIKYGFEKQDLRCKYIIAQLLYKNKIIQKQLKYSKKPLI